MSSLTKTEYYGETMNVEKKKFTSVAEYINDLIDRKKLAPEEVTFKKDDKNDKEKITEIIINGRLKIYAAQMATNLDYSLLTAKHVIFEGKATDEYSKLPYTVSGLSGDLPSPQNIDEFLAKNAFGCYRNESGTIVVEGNLSIPPMKDMNLQKLQVNGDILWFGGKIDYDKLPTSAQCFRGVNGKIKFPQDRKVSSEELLKKGIRQPKPQNKIVRFWNRILSLSA